MRYLHPISANERFIARGTYKHYHDTTLTGILQSWTIHELAGGAQLIRVDHDERDTGNGVSRLIEVLQSPDGTIERINMQLVEGGETARFRLMRLDFVFMGAYVHLSRTVDHLPREYAELETPNPFVVRLLNFSLFWGRVLQQPTGDLAQISVFVPILKPTGPMGHVQKGILPTILHQVTEQVDVRGKSITMTRYHTKGERVIWLNEQSIPFKLSHIPTNTHELLTNYAHR